MWDKGKKSGIEEPQTGTVMALAIKTSQLTGVRANARLS